MKSSVRNKSNNCVMLETQAKRPKRDPSLLNQHILSDNIRADLSRAFRFVILFKRLSYLHAVVRL